MHVSYTSTRPSHSVFQSIIVVLAFLNTCFGHNLPSQWQGINHPAQSTQQVNPQAYTSIQNTLSLFSFAYDTRQLSLLSQVFTATATTNFTAKSPMQTGVPAIVAFLNSTIIPGGSQHASSTVHVNQTGPDTADVTSYVSAIFFGSEALAGQAYQNYGVYLDKMVRVEKSGAWMIQNRIIQNFGGIGNIGVLGGKA